MYLTIRIIKICEHLRHLRSKKNREMTGIFFTGEIW